MGVNAYSFQLQFQHFSGGADDKICTDMSFIFKRLNLKLLNGRR